MRIVQMDFSGTLLKFSAQSEFDSSIYSSTLTTAENQFDLVLPFDPGISGMSLLDIPIFSEANDDSGFYVVGYGFSDTWDGCIVYYSNDGGGVWSQISAITEAAVIGSTSNALAVASGSTWDRSNALTLELYGGEISSATEANVLNGSNLAVVGTHGRWEIIQFADATLNANGSYTIQTLLRGRFGTENAIDTHQTNDIFVLINTNNLMRVPLGEYEINIERAYKAVTIGSSVQNSEVINFTNTAVGLRPYAVCHVRGIRDGSNNLTITWTRRDRLYGEGEWGNYASSTRSSDNGNYEIDIVGSSPARTISVSTESAIYTAAQQTTDGLTPGDPVDLEIYELSEIAGRGILKEVTV
jgi:hypothetical protein